MRYDIYNTGLENFGTDEKLLVACHYAYSPKLKMSQ